MGRCRFCECSHDRAIFKSGNLPWVLSGLLSTFTEKCIVMESICAVEEYREGKLHICRNGRAIVHTGWRHALWLLLGILVRASIAVKRLLWRKTFDWGWLTASQDLVHKAMCLTFSKEWMGGCLFVTSCSDMKYKNTWKKILHYQVSFIREMQEWYNIKNLLI